MFHLNSFTGKRPAALLKGLSGFFFDQSGRADEEVRRMSTQSRLYLSSKQVPSVLLLKSSGSGSLRPNLEELLSMGFPVEVNSGNGWELIPTTSYQPDSVSALSGSQIKAFSEYMSSIHEENSRYAQHEPLDEIEEEEEDLVSEPELPEDESSGELPESQPEADQKVRLRVAYADPFKVNAAVLLAEKENRPKPKVFVWGGDSKRLTDNIPSVLLGKNWKGGKRGLPFYKIASIEAKMHVLLIHTHWGNKLYRWIRDGGEMAPFARTLVKKIRHFLQGFDHPLFSETRKRALFAEGRERPKASTRSNRFLQMLNTVNGVLIQKYLAFPNMAWTWDLFDTTCIRLLDELINEEFVDGELTLKAIEECESPYSALKAVRKDFKLASHEGKLGEMGTFYEGIRSVFQVEYALCAKLDPWTVEYTRVVGILSQTRGAGTPPPLVQQRTKLKLLRTVTSVPPPLEKWEAQLIGTAMDELILESPDSAFAGLHTKAGVRISTSACFEQTRELGGNTQAVQDIVWDGRLGRRAFVRDLETGAVIESKSLDDCTPGEYIFWRCLEEVLSTPPEIVKQVSLVVVMEPAKCRSITKAHVYVKIILDVVNGICSYPLGKAYESSTSGMRKTAHAWEFFKTMFCRGDVFFCPAQTERIGFTSPTSFEERTEYEDVFMSSTDYETATDFLHHEVGRIIGWKWMTKCGIPPILKGIVMAVAFQPRDIFFYASGGISEVGDPTDDKNIRKVRLVRGVLMGDPLTKVILHFTNLCTRKIASLLVSKGKTMKSQPLHSLFKEYEETALL